MEQLILNNASAIFAILGTLAGAALTFFGTWILQNQEVKNRLLEKVLDRRIQAHENIIELSKLLRGMMSLGYEEKDGQLARTPAIMASKELFDEFLLKFYQKSTESSTWLSTKVTREFNIVQDYLVNLYEFVRNIDSVNFPEIGRLIRQDFIDFSTNLEKLSFEFFTTDLTKLKLNDLSKWHKYPLEVTKTRLAETLFFRRKEEIVKILGAKY